MVRYLNLSVTRGDVYLVVVQKRSSLLIGWNDGTLSSECEFLAENSRNCDDQGGKEEDSHDDECEDPLNCNGMCEELANANGSRQDAQFKAYSVVLQGIIH